MHQDEDNDKKMWEIWNRNEEEEEEDGGNTVRRHERNGEGEDREGV